MKERSTKQFCSEAHPQAYQLVKAFGPRIHTVALGLIIAFAMLSELAHGNALFILDWMEASVVVPTLRDWITMPGAFEAWATAYGLIALMAAIVAIVVIYALHSMVWRYLFKDYHRVIYKDWDSKLVLAEPREGRLYWYTGNSLYRLWDRLYGSPPRTEHFLYLRAKTWRPFNILNPPASLYRLRLSPEEKVEFRSSYKVVGHERPYRRREGVRSYYTHTDRYATGEVPYEQALAEFDRRTGRLVSEMKELTKGNSAIRLDKMRNVEIAEADFINAVEAVQGGEDAKGHC